jgi:hypothetical protein
MLNNLKRGYTSETKADQGRGTGLSLINTSKVGGRVGMGGHAFYNLQL